MKPTHKILKNRKSLLRSVTKSDPNRNLVGTMNNPSNPKNPAKLLPRYQSELKAKQGHPTPKPRPEPQVQVTAPGPLPLPEGWEEATLILGGRHYLFFYNPYTRRVHAPGYPDRPLHAIRLHDGKIIEHEDLRWDVENALGYDPGDDGSDSRRRYPIGWKPTTPSS